MDTSEVATSPLFSSPCSMSIRVLLRWPSWAMIAAYHLYSSEVHFLPQSSISTFLRALENNTSMSPTEFRNESCSSKVGEWEAAAR